MPIQGKLLDVGGGTGRVASAIHDLVDEITLADESFGMLANSPRDSFRSCVRWF
jgi:ubiquinone/menaquinone biosynthesis C-methylase UbiE